MGKVIDKLIAPTLQRAKVDLKRQNSIQINEEQHEKRESVALKSKSLDNGATLKSAKKKVSKVY